MKSILLQNIAKFSSLESSKLQTSKPIDVDVKTLFSTRMQLPKIEHHDFGSDQDKQVYINTVPEGNEMYSMDPSEFLEACLLFCFLILP